VRRERHPNDRRKVIIKPWQEQIERKIYPLFGSTSQAMANLYSSYNEAELAAIADFVHRTNQIAVEEAAKLKTITTRKVGK
jgi:DNA-binding MarR family transcriptional regulator